jgi:hypothetical protein
VKNFCDAVFSVGSLFVLRRENRSLTVTALTSAFVVGSAESVGIGAAHERKRGWSSWHQRTADYLE